MFSDMKSLIRKLFDGPFRRQAVGFTIAAALFAVQPAISWAVDLSGDSNTYVGSRQTADGEKILGGYEYLDLAVSDLGSDTVSFHTGGWLRYDLKGEEFGNKTNNDLSYSYLSFKSKTDNTIVNLGRVMVFEGVAAERVDGLYARTDLAGNFGVSAFGGSPVETNINEPGNNVIYGTRVSHQIPGLYIVGLSYLQEKKNSEDFRKEEGVDLWFRPLDKVELFGWSKYNAETRNWMDITYNLGLGPFAALKLNTIASWISYRDYFDGTTNPAFGFKPDVINPSEKVAILGEEAVYSLTNETSVSVDYKGYTYDIAGDAKYYGATVRYGAESGGAGLSYHQMDGGTDRLKYKEYRVYGYRKIGKTDLALDLLDVAYAAEINGVKNAYSASAAAGYELTDNLKAVLDAEYSKNPDFDKDIRVFLKLMYKFDLGHGAQGGA